MSQESFGLSPGVLGLDLSLTSTGVAGNARGGWTERITTRPRTLTVRKSKSFMGSPPQPIHPIVRMRHITKTIFDLYVRDQGIDLVAIEGPSFGSVGGFAHERAGLWWMVFDLFWTHQIPILVVPPDNRALYGSGLGNANKREMLTSWTPLFPHLDWGARAGLDDEIDALALAAMGADWLGHPLVSLPEKNRRALKGCQLIKQDS